MRKNGLVGVRKLLYHSRAKDWVGNMDDRLEKNIRCITMVVEVW